MPKCCCAVVVMGGDTFVVPVWLGNYYEGCHISILLNIRKGDTDNTQDNLTPPSSWNRPDTLNDT